MNECGGHADKTDHDRLFIPDFFLPSFCVLLNVTRIDYIYVNLKPNVRKKVPYYVNCALLNNVETASIDID